MATMAPLTCISPCCLPDLDVPKHSTGAGGTWHQTYHGHLLQPAPGFPTTPEPHHTAQPGGGRSPMAHGYQAGAPAGRDRLPQLPTASTWACPSPVKDTASSVPTSVVQML